MKFISEEFLLQNKTASRLYHEYAEKLPIIDYHCHISPKEIAEDKRFKNITEIWLGGDHYKWRMIRSNGTPENEITGDADDKTKFIRFAQALQYAIGNPMYHWTHLELKRYFGYNGVLNENTAEEVWDICNEKLASPAFSACSIVNLSNVRLIGTTDDPADDLEYHKIIKDNGNLSASVVPSFRPDRAIKIEKEDFPEYIEKLGKAAEIKIESFGDLMTALIKRLDFFVSLGCRASDHGLDQMRFEEVDEKIADSAFRSVMQGEDITGRETEIYKSTLLVLLGREYAKRGIVMQLHYGAQRNPNTAKFRLLGPDTGFDCIDTHESAKALTALLDALERTNELPKTIIYSLNPGDNEMIGSVIGSFQGEGARGKIQLGAAWWFNDTKRGMEEQLRSYADLSILGNFVGMLTDSRSFLSYTRHEYFRRILCNLIGTWVENGEYPEDYDALGKIVSGICYYNAEEYFGLE